MRSETKAQHSSLAAEAYGIIRKRIERGELVIGQAISRRRVAAQLAMSYLPVSEAFLQLEFEGLLESHPRVGTRVRVPSREDVEGHYVIREALEMQAARLYARFSTADERSVMLKLAARVDEIASHPKTDPAYYLNLHQTLHQQIAEFGRCPVLCEAIEKNWAPLWIWLCVGRNFGDGRDGPTHHQDLMRALGKGNPEEAATAIRHHIASCRNSVLLRLAPYFLEGNESRRTYTRR